MATQLYFSRDTKVYIEFDGKVWEIPVLDGFSFSQGNNTSELLLSEMESSGGVSRRGRRAFNDSLSSRRMVFLNVCSSFYFSRFRQWCCRLQMQPKLHAVEEVLWAMMAGADQL